MIINTYDQLRAAGGGVAICVAHGGIRERYVSGWSILYVSPDGLMMKTDPNGPWYNHGAKTFLLGHEKGADRKEKSAQALARAQAWVKEHLGEEGPWVRNAMRDFVPERIQKQFPIKRRK